METVSRDMAAIDYNALTKAQKIAAFKVPVDVMFWPETLPRNANGKIVKTELKKRLQNPES